MIEINRTGIELFGLTVHWYGVILVLGIALGVALAWVREKRMGLPKETTLDLALICIPAAIVGARIYFVIFSWENYADGPWWKVFAIWEGGLAIYGGIIAGVFAGWIYSRVKHLSFGKLTDLVAPSIALGQAIGRWGNYVNQEAHGALVENPSLQFFPMSVLIDGEWYYATFFYESMWCFLIVAVLLFMEHKRKFRKDGDEFFAYVFLYALERGIVEGLRTDSLYIGSVRVSQALSLLAALAVSVYFAHRAKGAARWIGSACMLAAIILSVAGSQVGTFLASLAALIMTSITYIKMDVQQSEEISRGDES